MQPCSRLVIALRISGILRNLSAYYYKEPTLLFLVRVAQGLVHMGKGLMSLSPYHTDRQLLSSRSFCQKPWFIVVWPFQN